MKYIVFSDPHIGYRPKSHVTTASAERYSQMVVVQAHVALDQVRKEFPDAPVLCLGDLFHKHSNSERVILEGSDLMARTNLCLNGNHDVLNVAGATSSFDLAWQLNRHATDSQWTHRERAEWGYWPTSKDQQAEFWYCCHYLTQADFEAAVNAVCSAAMKAVSHYKYLLLHCNVGEGYGGDVEADGSSLFLTKELREKASSVFDRILVGHEHVPRSIGNLQIVGNTIPLTFGEMADRFVWILDTADNSLTPARTLSMSERLLVTEVTQLSDLETISLVPEIWWVDLKGQLPVEDKPKALKTIVDLWKQSDSLLAIRNGLEWLGATPSTKRGTDLVADLPSLVREEAERAGFKRELEEIL